MTDQDKSARGLFSAAFPWPLMPLGQRGAAWVASAGVLVALLLTRLLLLAHGPWEQDEALLACGVVDFDPAHHMPIPPGFPLWVLIGRLVRAFGVADPATALQVASAVLSVVALWALVGIWDRIVGRPVALAGALLAGFIPGVWFHAGRAFSETPSAALAIVGVALWMRGGRNGLWPGAVALTAAALVRPPLAPLYMVMVLLAAWGARRDAKRVLLAGAACLALLLAVMVPLVGEAGGWELFWSAGTIHATEHFTMLGTESARFADLGFVRGLLSEPAAGVLIGFALLGWLALVRRLGWRWWAGSIAGTWLIYLLLFLHNHTYPRYWVLAWLLVAVPAVHGVAVLLRSRTAAVVVGAAAAGLAAWSAWPAVAYIHAHAFPPVAAFRHVASEGQGVVVFADELFSFRNYAARAGWLQVPSMRTSEIPPRRLTVGGETVWFLGEGDGEDLTSDVSTVLVESCNQPRVKELSQERFLDIRLVRNPVLVWRGGSVPESDGTRRFIWSEPDSLLLLPPVTGPGSVSLGMELHHRIGEVEVSARVDGIETVRTRAAGRIVLNVPIPALPARNRMLQVVPLELHVGGDVVLPGDRRHLAARLLACAVDAPPYSPHAYAFFPEADTMLANAVRGSGVWAPELLGDPLRPAAWSGPEARFEMSVAEGVVGVELLAPRPGPVPVEVSLGTEVAHLMVGAEAVRVQLPVTGDLARLRRGELIVRSPTFVPGPGDARALGVGIGRIWFVPDPLSSGS